MNMVVSLVVGGCLVTMVWLLSDTPPTELKDWLPAIAQVESNRNGLAEGKSGERGTYQIMEGTWSDMTEEPFCKAYNDKLNEHVALKYLKYLENWLHSQGQDGSINQVLACYNGGMGRFKQVGFDISKMPESTQEYISKVRYAGPRK